MHVELVRAAHLTDAVPYAYAAAAGSTVYVASADRADLVAAWDVVQAAFGDHDAPNTLLGVAQLGYSDQLVEVEAVAVRAPTAPSDESAVTTATTT